MAGLCGLDRSAVNDQLARFIWEARAAQFTLDVRDWIHLDPATKRTYIQIAQDVLEMVRPAPGASEYRDLMATISRSEAARILGRITPQAPWGVTFDKGR